MRLTRTLSALAAATALSGVTAGAALADPASTTTSPSSSSTTTSSKPSTSATESDEAGKDACKDTISKIPTEKLPAQLVTAAVSTNEELKQAIDAGVGNVYISSAGVKAGVLKTLPSITEAKDKKVGVSIDEEGGKVSRLKDVLPTPLPSAADQAKKSPEEIKKVAKQRASEMAKLGLTRDYAPVVDVGPSEFLGTRVASDDPKKVSEFAAAFTEGLKEGGIGATIKHFPGHGSTNSDTHQTAGKTASLEELKKKDLIPYKDLLKDPDPTTAVMVGHLIVPGLTEEGKVTSISPATMKLLRDGEGYGGEKFDGLILTDDLSGMKAVLDVLPAPEAAVAAVKAGADSPMITWPTDGKKTIEALTSAKLDKERLEESATRVAIARGECKGAKNKDSDDDETSSPSTTSPSSGTTTTSSRSSTQSTTGPSGKDDDNSPTTTTVEDDDEGTPVTWTPTRRTLS